MVVFHIVLREHKYVPVYSSTKRDEKASKTKTLYGGVLCGGNSVDSTGGIAIASNGGGVSNAFLKTFDMYGGTISGNSVPSDGFGDNPLKVFFADEVSAEKGYSIHIDDGSKDGEWEVKAVVDKAAGGDSDKLTVEPIKVTKTITLKYKSLKKKSATLARNKIMTVKNAVGELSYSKVSVNKSSSKFTVNKNTGALTVKNGIKKGQYKVKIKVTDTVTEITRNVTVKIKVK